jgi:hypothetical protein
MLRKLLPLCIAGVLALTLTGGSCLKKECKEAENKADCTDAKKFEKDGDKDRVCHWVPTDAAKDADTKGECKPGTAPNQPPVDPAVAANKKCVEAFTAFSAPEKATDAKCKTVTTDAGYECKYTPAVAAVGTTAAKDATCEAVKKP